MYEWERQEEFFFRSNIIFTISLLQINVPFHVTLTTSAIKQFNLSIKLCCLIIIIFSLILCHMTSMGFYGVCKRTIVKNVIPKHFWRHEMPYGCLVWDLVYIDIGIIQFVNRQFLPKWLEEIYEKFFKLGLLY
jgi:hypothetical protein